MSSTTTDTVSQTNTPLDRKIQTFVSAVGHELLRVEAARQECTVGSVIDSLAKAALAKSERTSNGA
jgi:hypothetical protein